MPRWRRHPDARADPAAADVHQLREGDRVVAEARRIPREQSGALEQWYWTGMGVDTMARPAPTLDAAKAEARAHYERWRAAR